MVARRRAAPDKHGAGAVEGAATLIYIPTRLPQACKGKDGRRAPNCTRQTWSGCGGNGAATLPYILCRRLCRRCLSLLYFIMQFWSSSAPPLLFFYCISYTAHWSCRLRRRCCSLLYFFILQFGRVVYAAAVFFIAFFKV